ncbi:hypothetical protein [Ruminococcus albus]|uniref:Uncharacterized protein n=1 Tax=Ruminococcus albus (strain ATCC 27210 / DSM 20455 / JCM 14654 / NCDO 2250 / 7) TaxID=697329 RepID=E6UGF6_RUMA7|nr:hypothetical protein [Ruminococcus albus]ADU21994.1 hypothetical protein Rumal_1493 [Ruminococcus albus 7 = DSM 20455]
MMRARYAFTVAVMMFVLTGCGEAGDKVSDAYKKSSDKPPATVKTTEVTTTEISTETTVETSEKTTSVTTSAITDESSEAVTRTETVTEEVSEVPAESEIIQEKYDTFYGILIDEDCSDVEDPVMHDLPCMLMEECRASGYGLDILQEDGSWIFYMFDSNGQDLAWEYLLQTEREYGLYVTVTGRWEDNVIKVISIEES